MGRRKRPIIYEAKDVKRLTKSTVDSTKKKYQYPWFPKETHIAIPRRTTVSDDVRDHAKKKKVKIDRLRY
jgi:hypothetical protein